ncbi:hypothetical protein EC973_007147 [Apophysomyces ossiformis]|uniref:Glutamate decarboxylase n=1 Tax=Apophysomyces ossiformis TaxID=679940 RepID=A0A8H7BZF8_9FUNG|nr:hypothetical protein EC973_007147 [Apophysomyces ossiformis]
MLHSQIGKTASSEEAEEYSLESLGHASRYATTGLPKHKFAEEPYDARWTPATDQPYKLVTTWMEPEAQQLINASLNKNLADEDEYPASIYIQRQCVSMISDLWHGTQCIGTSTVGSSEAIMLGGLAMKKRWQKKNPNTTSKPNIIMGCNAQVALEKFARYFDVEARLIPVSKNSNYVLDIDEVIKKCDQNTIGVFVILGSTYTGHFEDVKKLSEELDKLKTSKALDIPIHVDAASGGFVAPFAFPDLQWDFRVSRVVSINASGHKYGLSYPGVGWVVWRSKEYLPDELIFKLKYLGGEQLTYTLNFSQPSCFVIGQYYNFLRLGKRGYKQIIENSLTNARHLATELGNIDVKSVYELYSRLEKGPAPSGNRPVLNPLPVGDPGVNYKALEIVSAVNQKDNAQKYIPCLSVVSFKFSETFKSKNPKVNQADLSTLLRVRGWVIPNYPLPKNVQDTSVLRVVVRESFTRDLVRNLVEDTKLVIGQLLQARDGILIDTARLTSSTDWLRNVSLAGYDENNAVSASDSYGASGI